MLSVHPTGVYTSDESAADVGNDQTVYAAKSDCTQPQLSGALSELNTTAAASNCSPIL